jgi:hypothetical protein
VLAQWRTVKGEWERTTGAAASQPGTKDMNAAVSFGGDGPSRRGAHGERQFVRID